MDAVHTTQVKDNKTSKKGEIMPKSSKAKTFSLDKNRVENLKTVMNDYGISYRGDADAIHKAIDKYIIDLKLSASKPYPHNKNEIIQS